MRHSSRPIVTGCCLALVASLIFAVIAFNTLDDGPLVTLDNTIAQDMRQAASGGGLLRATMIAVTNSGGIAAMMIMATLGVIWQGWRGRGKGRVALGWALIVVGGAVLNLTLKNYFQRERPPKEWRDPVVYETNGSFPSGHTMGGTIGIGLLGYALMLKDRYWRNKLMIVVALGAWVMSIGYSRVYLRAHWFSDVLGGFALGLAWLSLGLGLLEAWRRQPPHGSPRALGRNP